MKGNALVFFILLIYGAYGQSKTEVYISEYSEIAIDEMNRFGIPASITLAQGILESGNGESRLAVQAKNHFGIKCHDNWNGKTIIEDDDEKGECFRKYNNVSDSYRDHSLFLTERGRYSFLFDYNKNDYKKWAKGLKKAGYATNPKYPALLIDLIEKYDLSRFDSGDKENRKFYFTNSYGFPYLIGVGASYFNQRSLYFTEINTSFAFTEAHFGYNFELLSGLYAGANSGIIYLPSEELDVIPHIAAEITYKREKKKRMLIRLGGQVPLLDIPNYKQFKVIPFLRLTYLLD
ncbi:MAG: hypothetical protein CMD16_01120 [Flavobacteriales bacterium]|nr:hypothetical protein [Flavobacteriales bacterium]|tara:strand:+ start:9411 stop:10283 length:873 start_codon:yes stop_codon:yes gene_type:complete